MKVTSRRGWSTHLAILLTSLVGVMILTLTLTSGHTDDEMSTIHHHHHHHHQHQHHPRVHSSRAPEAKSVPPRRRRHQKDRHQHHQGGDCSLVAAHFDGDMETIRSKTGGALEVLDRKIPASNQSICYVNSDHVTHHHQSSNHGTCCSLETESKLERLSVVDLEEMVTFELESLKVEVQNIVTSYEDHLSMLRHKLSSELSSLLHEDFHLPLKHVNSTIKHLDEHLDLYLSNGNNVDLPRIVEHFFDSTFALSYYYILHEPTQETAEPNASHSSCVLSAKNVFPGRSFVLARFRSSLSFIKTLRTMTLSIGEVVRLASNMDVDESCSRRLARANYCSKCSGVLGIPPCQSTCLSVITGCLATYMDLDFQWRDFIQVLLQLAGMTKNHESVVESFPFKVEEAMIHYHLEAPLMHEMVSNHCGIHNDSNWRKRNFEDLRRLGREMIESLNSTEFASQEGNADLKSGHQKKQTGSSDSTEVPPPPINMESSIKALENRWPFQNMAGDFCTRVTSSHINGSSRVECWNGTSLVEHSKLSYVNTEAEVPQLVASRSQNAALIGELLENNSMIIFKKTMGSSLPLLGKQYDSVESSGDYDNFLSGSGDGLDEFSGSGFDYDAPTDATDLETTTGQFTDFDFRSTAVPGHPPGFPEQFTVPSDFDFTDSSIHTSSSPPPKFDPKSTAVPGRPSGASSLSPLHRVLLLTSAIFASIFVTNSDWTLGILTLTLHFITLCRGCRALFSFFTNVVSGHSAMKGQ